MDRITHGFSENIAFQDKGKVKIRQKKQLSIFMQCQYLMWNYPTDGASLQDNNAICSND